jgi:antirestriction protein ArdC
MATTLARRSRRNVSADSQPREDVYTRVTNRIVAELERGVRPWLKPWNAEHAAGRICRPLRFNGERYSGVNVLMLWAEAETRGYSCPIWMTFQQALALGGHVRKGEHGAPVVYASRFTKTETTAGGDEVEREIPFLRQYTVFNAEQCDGLPASYYQPAEQPKTTLERIADADRFFAATGADVRHGGDQAFYTAAADYVQMPHLQCFRDAESYYSTLAHEVTHWTKHPSRLNRDFGRKRFGDEGYAVEELVAELGAAFLCADMGIAAEPREDHAAYLGHWLKVLRDDKRAIFTAASHASKAVEHLHSLQPTVEPVGA